MGRVAQTREPLIIPRYQEWEARSGRYTQSTVQTVIAVPLLIGTRLVGAIAGVHSDPRRVFGAEDLRLLGLFASQAAIAMAYVVVPTYGDYNNTQAYRKGQVVAQRALALDSTSVEARAALGMADLGLHQNVRAEQELRRAIALDSTFAATHYWLSLTLARVGRLSEAVQQAQIAHALDPLSIAARSVLAVALIQSRRFPEATRVARELVAYEPTYGSGDRILIVALLAEHRYQDALAIASRYVAALDKRWSWPLAELGVAYVANGRSGEARALLAELLERSRHDVVSGSAMAILYDALGDRERAIEWLARGVSEHDPFFFSRGPLFDGLRADPRGAALFARLESPVDLE